MVNAFLKHRAKWSEWLFASTTQQRRASLFLSILLLAVVYWPGIKVVLEMPVRHSEVGNAVIRASIPYTWQPIIDEDSISASRPCLSIFCNVPETSMKAQLVNQFRGRKEEWLSRTEAQLRTRGGQHISVVNEVLGFEGLSCVESMPRAASSILEIGCLNDRSGLVASYVGNRTHVSDFYKILKTVRPGS